MPSDETIETMAREGLMANLNPLAEPSSTELGKMTASIRAALSAAEAAGWVMVPRESVQAMIDRLQFCLDTFGPVQDQSSEAADLDDWRAMIEARP